MIEKGFELWQIIADIQNEILKQEEEIPRNNYDIWNILNRLTNKDWIAILTAVCDIQEKRPDWFSVVHEKSLEEVAEILNDLGPTNNRILDTKEYKKDAWRTAMILREIWNKIQYLEVCVALLL